MPLPLISARRRRRRSAASSCSRRRRVAGPDRDEPVGADAAVAVAQRATAARRRASASSPSSASRTRKSLPVACSLARCSAVMRVPRRSRLRAQRARTTPARSCGFRAAPTQLMRGSRRNHTRWRRANCRVRRTASVERVVERRRSRRRGSASTSLVADRLRARCATAAGALGERRAPRRPGPASRIARERARAMRAAEHRRAAARRRPCATSNAGGAVVVEAGTERRERPAGELRSLRARARCGAGCPARCAPRRPDRARRARAYARAQALASSVAASSAARTRRILGRDREVVDDRPHVEAGAADEQRPPAARLDVGDRGARRVLGARAPTTPRPGRRRRRGGAATAARSAARRLGGADVHAAVHLHRVERHDLDVAERARDRERERRLARRGRTDEREVLTRSHHRRPGCGRAPARRGRDPRDERRRAASAAPRVVMRDVDEVARRAVVASGAKCTSLFWRVRPDHTVGSFFDGPSTSTSSVRPTRASCLRQRVALDHLDEPLHALLHDLGRDEVVDHRRRPRCRAGARTRTCTRRRSRASSTTSSVRSKSASVSPGKPTMMSVVTARSGIAARAAASRSR